MKDILFNGHDVVLMLVIGFSFLLAFRTAFSSGVARGTRLLLTAFFLLSAFASLDTLLFWGDSIKYAAFDISPWLPMAFSFASFAVGPLLYWFFRSLNEPEKSLRSLDYLHLLPALITPFYLYLVCYRYPLSQQFNLILELSIFSKTEAYFFVFLTLKKMMPVIYGVVCFALVSRNQSARSRSTVKLAQLPYLYAGFPLIWGWVLLTHILGQWLPVTVSDSMGIFGNYMSVTLSFALLFTTLGSPAPAVVTVTESSLAQQRGNDATAISAAKAENHETENANEQNDEIEALAERIEILVEKEKPYLNSQLTLERFAHLVQASPRQVSFVINRRFKQNYHEYINRFRIEEAKRLLRDPTCRDLGILEIAQRAGFNSKATFNRFFKSIAGIPPSAYRQQPSADLMSTRLQS